MKDLSTARSLLFVPGTRPERFQKAIDAGADAVVIDLEDAVAPADKVAARGHVDSWLSNGGVALVRINARDTDWYEGDLEVVGRHGCPVMVPKVDSGHGLRDVRKHVPEGTALVPLIESAAAVIAAAAVCAERDVVRVAFGSFDLGAELGLAPERSSAFLFARSAIVLACAAAGISPPLDGVTANVGDPDVLRVDITHARELGFGGKLCIHPNQVGHVNASFTPNPDELGWAERVLSAAGNSGVAVVDGKMIDAPVLARARRLIAISQSF